MLKRILQFGLISGLVIGVIDFSIFTFGKDHDFDNGMYVGYATMLLALSAVFVGIKRYRDRDLGGVIRFWPAFGMGLAMSVIAGIFYVAAWEASQAITGGDFIGAYTAYVLDQARAQGKSAEAIAQMTAEMKEFAVQYANPWFRLPMTFSEIFPVGVLVSLVSAALLRSPGFLPVKRTA